MSLVSLNIHIDRLNDVLAFYDRIQVHRSTTGVGGAYTEITDAAGPTAAQVDGTASGPFALDGLTLDLTIDSIAVPVVFSGTDPLDLATVLTQINAAVSSVASEVPTDTDKVRLTSTTTGTGSSILVTGSAAATELGLATTQVNGKIARIILVVGTTDYQFLDLDGADSYFYKTRYSITTNPAVSSFSDPRQGVIDGVVVAPAGELIAAELSLLDGVGKPVIGRKVRFVLQTTKAVDTTAYQAIPGVDANVFVTTTATGFATINLLKGALYKMIIEGTSFIREFTVPDSGPFDVLALVGSAPDPFDIVQAPARPIKVTV